jgi:hypothetical protein
MEWNGIYFRCGVEPTSSSINEQVPQFWVIFMAKNFHNGTNITAKHDIIILGEEIFEFFMASMGKTHRSLMA